MPIHSVLQEEVLDHIPALAMKNAMIRAANVLKLREGSEETRVSAHWSRHFYATTLADAEVPDDLIAMALGHKRRNITQGYIHRNKNRLAEYVERAFLELRGCANGVQIENAVQQSGFK